MTVTLDDIKAAAAAIEGEVVKTPTTHSRTLSRITGAEVVLKFENLQYTGSFKDRGALVKLKSLTPEEKAAGVIAMSAGNHAQAVAYHSQRLGIAATIVMPQGTPQVKASNTQRFGARVVFEGETIDEAAVRARAIAEEEGLSFVHPYDDEKTIAGQGTVALEMLADHPDLDMLVVPLNIVDEHQHVIALITEFFSYGQAGQGHAQPVTRRLVHLAVHQRYLAEYISVLHLVIKVIAFTGTLTDPGKD